VNYQPELFQEVVSRIIQVSQLEVRQILQAEGRLVFPENGLQLHSQLPPDLRERLFALIDYLKASAASTSAAQRLVLESPGLRPIQIAVSDDVNESLIDVAKTVQHQQQWREILKLEARCRVAMNKIRDVVAITDQKGWHLDCNYTKQKIGIDRMDAIGALIEELFPAHLANLFHEKLTEAFRYTNIPIHWEFIYESIPGIPWQFRARTIAYKSEAFTLITLVNAHRYPWLS
jgi:PAS domain-containing protein